MKAKAFAAGDRVRLRGTGHLGTVNEVAGEYAYVSWDGARTRKDLVSWIEAVGAEPCNCGQVGPKECEQHGPRE